MALGQSSMLPFARQGPPPRRRPGGRRGSVEFCTLLAERGVAAEVIRDLAGHRDFRTTVGYVRVADGRRRRAIDDTFSSARGALQ